MATLGEKHRDLTLSVRGITAQKTRPATVGNDERIRTEEMGIGPARGRRAEIMNAQHAFLT